MFALFAAITFFIALVFKPDTEVNLTLLGLLLLSLHFVFEVSLSGLWARRRP